LLIFRPDFDGRLASRQRPDQPRASENCSEDISARIGREICMVRLQDTRMRRRILIASPAIDRAARIAQA